MSVVIGDKKLTLEDVEQVARHNEKVELASSAVERIKKCRQMLDRKIKAKEIMYGVNTGIGEFSEIVLDDEQVKEFQKYLIYNHSAGIGEPAPIEHIRAAMLTRINVQSHGHSGCRPEITQTLVALLNKGVTPVVCEKGSVGACGDLAPMSQIALLLMGEGEAFYNGKRLPSSEAMKQAGVPIPGLHARDGLATINGSNLIAGIGCLELLDTERMIAQAEIACAMSLEALMANMKPYDERLHKLRGFTGAATSANNIRSIIEGSDLVTGKLKVKVQDAYSMRSTPQVIGAARDHLAYARKQFEIEINGVGDNPIFLPDDDTVLTGANFQGTPISMPLDMVGASIAMICVLSERRLNRLLNPALSIGLPAFLTKGAGMYSGHMLSQYTAGMLIVEQRILSNPSCVQSIPAAADQEDFVSMGMNGALKTKQILKNACGVIGIELIAAAQALDFRDFKPGQGTQAAHSAVRKVVEHLDKDRPLYKDHNNMAEAVKQNEVLKAVENKVGPLSKSW
ncbi:MAG: aromatic amino acid lyase [candidate division Zixibacteria bacterium]|nr:aromatic amino acid lyase [candidate division Zixibacteria bacterium]